MRYITIVVLVFCFNIILADNNESSSRTKGKTISKNIYLIKNIPTTPVKNQHRSGTCWSFSGISLLETELIRNGKGEHDLSEMFIVHQTYTRKAEKYVRLHGQANFSAGGETNDVTDVVSSFGIIPDEAYSGLPSIDDKHNHGALDRALQKYMKSLITHVDKQNDPGWREEFDEVIDTYLGEIPTEFIYEGKQYTSTSFADSLGLNPEDYIMITSFTHHPFYQPVILEIPDNWSEASSYNVPLEVLVSIVDTAIMNGFSVAWSTDISEDGFSFEKGFALAPKIIYAPDSEAELSRWKRKIFYEKEKEIFNLNNPIEEVQVSQELRQESFENHSTTDDHGMQILGIARDKNQRDFYYVKNSWGEKNPYQGYMLVTKPYFELKTVSIMLNREALTDEVRTKLNL